MPAKDRDDERPTIKDDARYDALREKGMSKEKAARIANAADAAERGERRSPSAKGGEQPPYDEWTRDELYKRAQEVGIDGRSDMTKDELIDALRNH